ncbi:MAG: imidazole glycerol phosphate synthase subunit HisF [Campylobacterales bacterium]|nr:imidazole glycerol phosphate synthase subunit HisF [Campylobacterales bacterium]
MLKKRVIPVLLLQNGRMVKGKQFKDFVDTGDPVSSAKVYSHQDADELIFLDITATIKKTPTNLEIIEKVSKECFMPLTIGGGIKNMQDIENALKAGADKVCLNSAVLRKPSILKNASQKFGSQCIVVCVDVRLEGVRYEVYSHNGTINKYLDFAEYLKYLESLGAGEIIINSIDRDGMMCGYDLELIRVAREATKLPLIALGGAGNFEDLYEGFSAGADAVACSSLFHFGDNNPLRAKAYLKNKGIALKKI